MVLLSFIVKKEFHLLLIDCASALASNVLYGIHRIHPLLYQSNSNADWGTPESRNTVNGNGGFIAFLFENVLYNFKPLLDDFLGRRGAILEWKFLDTNSSRNKFIDRIAGLTSPY
uniref:Uncharacterized protein n=1 Tax=Lotharella globosa TaxID=91324 RepID=A0A7S4DZD8_9EUKA